MFDIFFFFTVSLILFEKQLRLYEEEKLGEKSYAAVSGDFEGGSLRGWELTDVSDRRHYCILVHRRKHSDILMYEIRKGLLSYSLEGGERLTLRHKIEEIACYECHLVCSSGKNVYIYKNIR